MRTKVKKAPDFDVVQAVVRSALGNWKGLVHEASDPARFRRDIDRSEALVEDFFDQVEEERELLKLALEACRAISKANGMDERVAATALAYGVTRLAAKRP